MENDQQLQKNDLKKSINSAQSSESHPSNASDATNSSNKLIKEYNSKSQKLKFLYVTVSLIKTCIGIYILYNHRQFINQESNLKNQFIFYLTYYTFIWPIALIGSFTFFLAIFSIDCLLSVVKYRSLKKVDKNIHEYYHNFNFKFLYSTFIITIVVSYVISIPTNIYLMHTMFTNDIQIFTNSLTFAWFFTYFTFNFLVSLLVFIMFIYYVFATNEINKYKIDIEDNFIENIKKEMETSQNDERRATDIDYVGDYSKEKRDTNEALNRSNTESIKHNFDIKKYLPPKAIKSITITDNSDRNDDF